jgi:hypothetical protein
MNASLTARKVTPVITLGSSILAKLWLIAQSVHEVTTGT